MLPSLELAYALLSLSRAPRNVIIEKMLPTADAALEILKYFEGHEGAYCGVGRAGRAKMAELKRREGVATRDDMGEKASSVTPGPSRTEKGKDAVVETGYWDDYCLATFLRGVCLRYIAYPVSHLQASAWRSLWEMS